MIPVPCSSAISESSDGKKSKAAPLIQKKKETVKWTQVQSQRMFIELIKSQTMPNTLNEMTAMKKIRTNEDNISRASMYIDTWQKWKTFCLRHQRKKLSYSASDTKEKSCHLEETYRICINIKSPFWSGINSHPCLQEKTSSGRCYGRISEIR
jgi:hypothetical protein